MIDKRQYDSPHYDSTRYMQEVLRTPVITPFLVRFLCQLDTRPASLKETMHTFVQRETTDDS